MKTYTVTYCKYDKSTQSFHDAIESVIIVAPDFKDVLSAVYLTSDVQLSDGINILDIVEME